MLPTPLPDDGMSNSAVHGQPRDVTAFLTGRKPNIWGLLTLLLRTDAYLLFGV